MQVNSYFTPLWLPLLFDVWCRVLEWKTVSPQAAQKLQKNGPAFKICANKPSGLILLRSEKILPLASHKT